MGRKGTEWATKSQSGCYQCLSHLHRITEESNIARFLSHLLCNKLYKVHLWCWHAMSINVFLLVNVRLVYCNLVVYVLWLCIHISPWYLRDNKISPNLCIHNAFISPRFITTARFSSILIGLFFIGSFKYKYINIKY